MAPACSQVSPVSFMLHFWQLQQYDMLSGKEAVERHYLCLEQCCMPAAHLCTHLSNCLHLLLLKGEHHRLACAGCWGGMQCRM
jgi:hypothetical protein